MENNKPEMIRVVKFSNNKTSEVVEIENSLKGMQDAVGGLIQFVPLPFGLLLLCNDEGMFECELQERYRMYGDFYILASAPEGEVAGLSKLDALAVGPIIHVLLEFVNRA